MKPTIDYIGKLKNYRIQSQPDAYRPVEEYFKCQVGNLNAVMLPVLNGWFVSDSEGLATYDNGVMVGSLKAALAARPELVKPYLGQFSDDAQDELTRTNAQQFTDGVFIYVPDNVVVEQPFQIVSLINGTENLLVQNRNVIHVGRNAQVSVIQCDDSMRNDCSFTNVVTEIDLAENARFSYYKTENKDTASLLFNRIFVSQRSNSLFHANAITFNAGYVCNDFRVNLNEPFAEARLYGLYLMDKNQKCDTRIRVSHNATDGKSFQLFKGIMDDEAEAGFHGHVVVQPDAQRTAAFQTNRNLLLTDKARVNTQPFLEIYADDVQCSHGATVGQLDDEALFYLRSRGIGERNARKLLMFAFANEICHHVEIQALQDKLSDMVQRRLNGELTTCDRCMLHDAEQSGLIFPIDSSKL